MAIDILLVEPNGAQAAFVSDLLLSDDPQAFRIDPVETIESARRRLAEKAFDAVLLDLEALPEQLVVLPDFITAAAELPVIVLTRADDRAFGTMAVQAGAQDVLVMSRINGDALRRVVRYSCERLRAIRGGDGLGSEIAERRRVEEALRESRYRMQAVTESLFEGILVIDANGHIIFSNRSADTLLGDGGRTRLVGAHMDAIFRIRQAGGSRGFDEGPLRHVAETGRVLRDDDAVFELRDGRLLMVAFACSPLVEEGRRKGAIVSFRDIHGLKKAQQEALQASKLASVGQLAAGIAHEINTPTQYIGDNLRFLGDSFTAVTGLLARLRQIIDCPPGSLAETGEAMRRATAEADLDYLIDEIPKAIAQSLDGLGQVSRIVLAMKEFSHPGEREKVVADLNQAIEHTLAVSRNEWKHFAEIRLDLDAGLPKVFCLPGELNQVLLNLVVNAVHAIEAAERAGKGWIAIATRQRGDVVEITVEDDGIGMAEDVKERIFDPFFTTKPVGKGTGQGLSICRDVVVNKHGGRISVETEQGRGAKFTITLPVNGATQPAEALP